MALSLLGTEIWRSFWRILCAVSPFRRAVNTRRCSNKLISPLEFCSQCELDRTLSAIDNVVSVIISDLLSACVANLYKCCFSRYLCFLFSGIFED
ncbi:hypothetical protein AVEN_215153-1 [Araneus ventricosus]|uniref:Uncharacterized protein n=1 Tax=Araneus ventricosus TaxID=182803 RepID=A0A4Y2RVF3_ARAVE|nr:hypothetical protein AVEN_260493-1 [Araneus ventricosus]GBN79704.1 hypothetical protein AVEN_78581-1 [Araneus ventricosus]GBN79716.1 hypothetical protein AVEN_139594-1 [Araneus ventricosus]GBN79742.1 hypothetical protein AVEN_215153-1 [Araneus ventricosus]